MASLPPGSRVGPYEVIAPIGAGGMGEVFRARDLTLNRDVALKILPPSSADDPDRRRRFTREAQLLASLNHPNIAQIFGVEESAAGPAIAMELVDGRPLKDILAAGPMGEQAAIALAREVALALDAAHEKGIIHRDLKPANIVITPAGTAKVLDFGLAKVDQDASGADDDAVTESAGTALGSFLGTPAYMSPEQARGQTVDRRTDVWAFGCLLFELLSGRQAFGASTMSDTVSAVLTREPDWNALPADTPAGLRRLIRRCLEKDRRDRLRDIGDALYELSGATSGVWRDAGRPTTGRPVRWASPTLTLALALSTLVLAASTAWLLTREPATTSNGLEPVRLALPPPPGAEFGSKVPALEANTLAMAPDGRALAFIATAGKDSELWIRSLGDDDAHPIAGTAGAISAFWKPDGSALGFFADGQLKRVDVNGGAPVKLCDVPAGVGLAGTWSSQGDILFTSADGIARVPAAGGTPITVVSNSTDPPVRVRWPHFLPDGQRFLYTALRANARGQIMLAGPDGNLTELVAAESRAEWVEPDWLLYVRESTLIAQKVDLDAGRTVGDPVSVEGRVGHATVTGWSAFSASRSGNLVVQKQLNLSRIAWFDRDGRELGDVTTPGGYLSLRLSPDDTTLAFSRLRPDLGTYDLWTIDLERSSELQLTTATGMEVSETWVPPDGRTLVFSSGQGSPPNLIVKDLATGAERRLLTAPYFQWADDVSPDGTLLVYQQRGERGDWDLRIVPLAAPDQDADLVATTAFEEHSAQFSPDGRQVAYVSTVSSRNQVYLSAFPAGGSRPIPVSSAGGDLPRWSHDGRELFFIASDRHLMVAPVDAAGRPGEPRPLFDVSRWLGYDVARDGRLVAIVLEADERDQPLTVTVGWPQLVGR